MAISEDRTEEGYTLIVDRYDDPETGKQYLKGMDMPPLSEEDVERFSSSDSIAPSDSVLAQVSRGEISSDIVQGAKNKSASQLRQEGETLLALADEREQYEEGMQGVPLASVREATSQMSGWDVGTDASGNRLRAPSWESAETVTSVDAYEKQEVQETEVVASSEEEEEQHEEGGSTPTPNPSEAGGPRAEPRATSGARREARERGIDLSEVTGTGTGGQISVADVRNHPGA